MMRSACVAGAAALLTACAHTVTPTDDGLNAAQREAQLSQLAGWNLDGNLIVDDGEKRERIRSVEWIQRGDELRLTGRGLVGWFRIEGDADRLIIETSRSEPRTLDNPEADLSVELGWWLPVSSLRHWLLGLPDPDPAFPSSAQRSRSGTLNRLQQRDWQIDYPAYQLANGILVPELVTLTHQELELRLTVETWETSDTQP